MRAVFHSDENLSGCTDLRSHLSCGIWHILLAWLDIFHAWGANMIAKISGFRNAFVISLISWATLGHAATDLTRLTALLATTPDGGWVKANTTSFSSAWPNGLDAVPASSYSNPATVIAAWSSFAWDSMRGDLIIFGGGHANYSGNEVYTWDGATGAWGRGSLPSRMETLLDASTGLPGATLAVDRAAPQSAHTYDNNLYLPINDRFLTFGGAAFNTGGRFATAPVGSTTTTNLMGAGPWVWDPAKADPLKVGGTTGSGYDSSREGGNMWADRQASIVATEFPRPLMGTTAYRSENGKDVVYLTSDQASSGFAKLFRYTFGDVNDPNSVDIVEVVGTMSNSVVFHGAGTIDTANNLYIRTAINSPPGGYFGELAVWDLNNLDPLHPARDIAIDLVMADGTPFAMTEAYGLDYYENGKKLLLWDGEGEVWYVDVPDRDALGNLSSTVWLVHRMDSATSAHPTESFPTGVLGKWHYVDDLGAFVALEENTKSWGNTDGTVWLYRPDGWQARISVPEPDIRLLFILGFGLAMTATRRKYKSA